MTKQLAPSILASDVMRLGEAARLVRDAGCETLHLDIMDGVFVPNISFGPAVLYGLRREVSLVMDVHLMLLRPLDFVDVFADAGADILTVHVEAEGFEASLKRIRERGLTAGASLKPGTPIEALRDYLPGLDSVLIMTVHPGFGGQKLIESQIDKIRGLRGMGFEGVIEVDGGVGRDNAKRLVDAGADVLVMGTSFFKDADPKGLVEYVRGL